MRLDLVANMSADVVKLQAQLHKLQQTYDDMMKEKERDGKGMFQTVLLVSTLRMLAFEHRPSTTLMCLSLVCLCPVQNC